MNEEKVLLKATLVLPIRNGKVLLAKKVSKIGAGCWNGYGGGIEPGEDAPHGALRELKEESSLIGSIEHLNKVAIIYFENTKTDGTTFLCCVDIYILTSWTGELKASPEMTDPTEFDIDKIPLDQMMLADKEWLPLVLSGKKIVGRFYYGPYQKTLIKPSIIEKVSKLT